MSFKKITAFPKSVSFLLGALAVLALPPFWLLPILWLSFGGLFWLVSHAPNLRQAFSRGYWFGFGFFAFGFSWIGNALLIDARSFGWLYPLVPLASGAFFGLFAAFPALLTRSLKTIPAQIVAFPAFWVFFEWLRSFILTGFPWNLLGSVLTFSPLTIQAAALGGTYLLSLLTLYMAIAPVIWLSQRTPARLAGTLLTLLLPASFILLYGNNRLTTYTSEPDKRYLVRLVQPAIPQRLKWSRTALENNFQKYIELSRLPAEAPLSLIVWGETASPFPLELDNRHRQQLLPAIPENGTLAVGTLGYKPDNEGKIRPVNAMLLLNHQGKILNEYNKTHLVPFGEYIPFRSLIPRSIRPITNVISDFLPGNGPETFRLPGLPALSAAICYEIIFPSQIINKQTPPEILLNLTNDGWYGKSAGPYQHLAATMLRAVEEGVTIIRAANSGISGIFTPTGILTGKIPLHQSGISDTWLSAPLSIPGFYRRYGNKIPLSLCLILTICGLILPQMTGSKSKTDNISRQN